MEVKIKLAHRNEFVCFVKPTNQLEAAALAMSKCKKRGCIPVFLFKQ